MWVFNPYYRMWVWESHEFYGYYRQRGFLVAKMVVKV